MLRLRKTIPYYLFYEDLKFVMDFKDWYYKCDLCYSRIDIRDTILIKLRKLDIEPYNV